MPAIAVRLEGGKLELKGRHKYLRAAERLGRERIRMVVSGASLHEFVAQAPHEHRDWSSKLLGALFAFHSEFLAIDSYQGSRFGVS